MNNHKIYRNKSHAIHIFSTGTGQVYLIVSASNNEADPREIYDQIAGIIKEMEIQILQEKVFANIPLHNILQKAREDSFVKYGIMEDNPVVYIEGAPVWGEGFAGIQICAIENSRLHERIWTIYDEGIPCGRGMDLDGATFLLLQNMHGSSENNENKNNRPEQVNMMFEKTVGLLKKYNAEYKNVVCTRIYISNILDWYDEFNLLRNAKYTELGIIPTKSDELITEQIYLPASTGIRADNLFGAEALMNVLAVIKSDESEIKTAHDNGVKQKSAYRYGSAFSRAAVISSRNDKCVLLSGTAAIDEQGKSLFPGNPREQIRKTFEVVEALLGKEGVSLKDICHATVFLKRKEDAVIYNEVIEELGLSDMPAVCVTADVCRDELLFEIDAIAAVDSRN